MADATLPGLMLTGNHAARPAATAVGSGALYSCSTHSLVYQSDASTWATWATLGGGAPAAHAASHQNGGSDEIDATGLTGVGSGGALSPFWWNSDNAPGSPNAANREFTEGTVVGTLTRVAHGTPKGTWAETANGLEWTFTASGATDLDVYAIARTVSIGDYVTIAGTMPDNSPLIGPFVGFSNGTTFGTSNAVGATVHHNTGLAWNMLLNYWAGFNSRANDGTVLASAQSRHMVPWGIRCKYEAANTWGLYIRQPGGQWRTIQTNYSQTLSPTHVVFGVNMTNAPAFTANAGVGIRLETFRVND